MKIGSACQSNPRVQLAALETGSLPRLIRLVAFDSTIEVRSRAIYAISSIIRHFPEAQKAFLHHGGISAFAQIFLTDSADFQKLQLKVVTLLSDLIKEKNIVQQMYKVTGEGVCCYFYLVESLMVFLYFSNVESRSEAQKHIDKRQQYDDINVEKVLVEQGFCTFLPRLLSTDANEHDVVEKVIQAMLLVSQHCRNQFISFRHVILHLREK